MKKLLTTLLLLLTVCFANAQVCKISDSGDNVEVFKTDIDGDTVRVLVSNDSENIRANVTVSIEVTYTSPGGYTIIESFSGKGLSRPNQTSIIAIAIPEKKGNCLPTSVKVTRISGTKCR